MIIKLVLAAFIFVGTAYANRFIDLQKEGVFSENSVLFHALVYDDSSKIYHDDLVEFINQTKFPERADDSISVDASAVHTVVKVNIHGFALLMAINLCTDDPHCKELLWQKRNGSAKKMSTEMFSALVFLLPERLPILQREFKKYPSVHLWQSYSLSALSLLSSTPLINQQLADTVKNIMLQYQQEWDANPQYRYRISPKVMNNLDKRVTQKYVAHLDASIDLQKSRILTRTHQFMNWNPVIIEVLLENLVHDEKWDRICPEYERVLKEKIIWHNGSGPTALWTWIIQKKCGTISKKDLEELRHTFLTPYYANILTGASYPTPVLNKLLHDYAQELLAEQRKKNPVKWRIWPEIVGPRK